MNLIYASKLMTSSIVKSHGVRCPKEQMLTENDISKITQAVPLIVKPSKEDNSHGVTLVKNRKDLQAALDEAFKWDDEVLVQEYIPGREIRVGVTQRGGKIEVHALLEYLFNEKTEIRAKNDKYCHDADGNVLHFNIPSKNKTSLGVDIPATTSDALAKELSEMGRKCFVALNCKDYGVYDFRIAPPDANGREVPYFLEIVPFASFSPSSVIVSIANKNKEIGHEDVQHPKLMNALIQERIKDSTKYKIDQKIIKGTDAATFGY